MAARLASLGDDDVRSRALGGHGLVRRADLIDDDDTRFAQPRHNSDIDVPEQSHDGHAERDDRLDLAFEQVGRGRRGDDIDAKAVAARPAQFSGFLCDQRGGLAHHAQKTESPRPRDRGDQFGSGRSTHAGKDDRMRTAQQRRYAVRHDSALRYSSKTRAWLCCSSRAA